MSNKKNILNYLVEFAMVFFGVLLAFYFSQLGDDRRQRQQDRELLELLSSECDQLPAELGDRIDLLDSAENRIQTILGPADSVLIDSVNAIMIDVVIPLSVRVRDEEPIILVKPQIDQRFFDDVDLREALETYYQYSLAAEEVSDDEQSFIKQDLRPYFETNFQYFGGEVLNDQYHSTPQFRNYMLHLLRYTAIRKAIFAQLVERGAALDSIVEERLEHF